MLGSSDNIAFIAITDADEALAFYQGILGLTVVENSLFSIAFDSGHGMIRAQKVEKFSPHPFTALGWRVDDVAQMADRLAEAGIQAKRFGDFMQQDARGIWTSPDGAKILWFDDPFGNVLSLSQWPD